MKYRWVQGFNGHENLGKVMVFENVFSSSANDLEDDIISSKVLEKSWTYVETLIHLTLSLSTLKLYFELQI